MSTEILTPYQGGLPGTPRVPGLAWLITAVVGIKALVIEGKLLAKTVIDFREQSDRLTAELDRADDLGRAAMAAAAASIPPVWARDP